MSTCKRAAARGFTIIELVVFIIIVSIAVIGLLSVFSVTTNRSADPQLRKQALVIAEGMLEEIMLARFTFCDPTDPNAETAASVAGCSVPERAGQETGGVGRPFDNVSDYVTQFATPAVPAATAYTTDAAGNNFPAGYAAQVSITPDAGLGPAGLRITPADDFANMTVLRITVRVTYGANASQNVTLDGYRTRHAPNAMP